MNIIKVDLGKRSYPIYNNVALTELSAALKIIQPGGFRKALIFTHPSLKKLYGDALRQSLRAAECDAAIFTFPEGETSKSLEMTARLYRQCLEHKLDRKSVIIALGGGVVGDVAGFVAATYMRGIALVHVPTTLLAMVDSSIGGKTGVDLPQAKNCVGAIYQPRLVWVDPSVLATLPRREWVNGMAEVIKYGIISDKALFEILEAESPLEHDHPTMASVIQRCAKIKADVVSKDEHETLGLREILNFGHTLGHAVESVTRYKVYKHGEAVAMGMAAAGRIAVAMGLWNAPDCDRLENLMVRNGLPIRLQKALPEKSLLSALSRDKKSIHGEWRFVLPIQIGKVIVKPVSADSAAIGLLQLRPQQKSAK